MEEKTISEAQLKSNDKFNNEQKKKEFFAGEHFIRIEITQNNELLLVYYNIKKLDGIKYSRKYNLTSLHKINTFFKSFGKIDDIFLLILKLIDEKKYNIINNISNVSFNFSVNFQNNSKEIIFILNKGNDEKNQGLDDYSKILSNEIIKFRKVLDLLITSYNSNNKIITNNVNEINSLKEENKTIKNELNTLKQLITKKPKNSNNNDSASSSSNNDVIIKNTNSSVPINRSINKNNKNVYINDFNQKYKKIIFILYIFK